MTGRPWVRSEIAIALLALALLLPRLSEFGSEAVVAVLPDESARAAVGYARLRLWSEFLQDRELPGKSAVLPPPTLTEYRAFLTGLGLRQVGDRISLLVLPLLEESRLGRQIDVCISRIDPPPIVLKLYVARSGAQAEAVGQLAFQVGPDLAVSCQSDVESRSKLLSFWPVRPSPLLP